MKEIDCGVGSARVRVWGEKWNNTEDTFNQYKLIGVNGTYDDYGLNELLNELRRIQFLTLMEGS